MTYLTFLLVFLVPPIVALLFLIPRPLHHTLSPRAWWSLPLVAVIAFVYTTPWDNYLVYRSVWWYGEDRVLGTIGYVPYEEYAFFVLQPIMTGLFLYFLLSRSGLQPEAQRAGPAVRWVGTVLLATISAVGIALILGPDEGLYMGLILGWAVPVLALMWLYGGPHIWRYRRAASVAITVPTLYLWVADRTAIRLGIWDISNVYSFDIDPFGLPIEEATFFLVTNVLVVFGVFLFLHGDQIQVPLFSKPAPRQHA
ncbi:MAG: lycopene cyclase domain-containing protein [Bacteroidota bacterium]